MILPIAESVKTCLEAQSKGGATLARGNKDAKTNIWQPWPLSQVQGVADVCRVEEGPKGRALELEDASPTRSERAHRPHA